MFDRLISLFTFCAMCMVGIGIGATASCAPVGTAVRDFTNDCTNTFPLEVSFEPVAEDLREGFDLAFDMFNQAVGETVFLLAPRGEVGDVHVTLEPAPPEHTEWVASTLSTCVEGRAVHAIRWHKWQSGIELYVFAAHELGHVLGLSHNKTPHGLMNSKPEIPDFLADDEEAEPPLPTLTEGDRMTLRSLYRR